MNRCRIAAMGCMLAAAGIFAQHPSNPATLVIGELQGEGCDSLLWLFLPMDGQKADTLRLTRLPSRGNTFRMEVTPEGWNASQMPRDSLFSMIAIGASRQIIHPVSLCPGQLLKVAFADHQITIGGDADNRALSAITQKNMRLSRQLWENGEKMDADGIASLLREYRLCADSIVGSEHCRAAVEQYIRLFAYTSMRGQYDNLDFITKKKGISQQIEDSGRELWPVAEGDDPLRMLDTPMALYFNPTTRIIMQMLPKASLEERLEALHSQYNSKPVVKRVSDQMMWSLITNFDYGKHYDEGLALISHLTKRFSLDTTYVEAFKKRRYATKGAAFPAEVTLTDRNGKRVDFSSFRGKYVYIDVWASWCVPCMREIPHLQQMEKEIANGDDVVFLSISIDQDVNAWKRKMDSMQLHGYQLHDTDGQLSNCLNITGIPKFLIYDREGRLLHYDAPRPSSGEKLRQLLAKLTSEQ
ncbi:MAG: TlpA family protein disulfide reductase [Prevotella sp.]|nr:TlpA family protein disulfide reductase [Prevotella sp.]